MRYVAVDVETTGIGKGCGLLELAMVEEDTESPRVPVEDLPYFRALFWPAPVEWEVPAIRMHLDSGLMDELVKKAAEESLDAFRTWVDAASWLTGNVLREKTSEGKPRRPSIPTAKIVPAGKNFAGFDRRFMHPEIANMFDYRAIYPGSLFVDWTRDRLPGLADLLPDDRKGISHRALEDARDVVRVLRGSYAK
jgi:oligoribonuclease (3'-5' exoribonuclease)